MLTCDVVGAGVPSNLTNANRTDWPLAGGSIVLDLHHPWAYIFINLGLGDGTVTNFNYSLTPEFLNSTGKGTLCIPTIPLPSELNVTDGTPASIQVITLGETGTSLYNCADITFRANATALSGDACKTDEGVSFVAVQQQSNDTATNGTTGSNSTNSTDSGSGESAGSATGVSMVALSSVVGLAVLFCLGIGA